MNTERMPDGWTRVKFGDVVRKVSDRVDPETAAIERYVAGEHMDTDDLSIRRWGDVGDGYLGPAFHMRFKPGQVLYGSRRTYLRKVAVADFEGICANTTFVLEPSSSDLLPQFLPLVMTTEAFHDHSIKQSKGSVNPYINFSDLTWYEFALPPIDEQRRIVTLVAATDRVAERWRTAEACTRQLLDALVAQMHQESAFSEQIPLTVVAELQPGRQLSPEYQRGQRPVAYLRAANLRMDWIDYDDIKEMDFSPADEHRYRVRENDVLLVEGGDADKVGAPSFVSEEPTRPLCMQNTVIRVRAKGVNYSPRFLYWLLRGKFMLGEFERLATGTKLYHLGLRKVESLEVPSISLEDQEQVARRLDKVHAYLTAVRGHRVAATHMRSALISKMVEVLNS